MDDSLVKTARAARVRRLRPPAFPAGLLQCYPLGDPPGMRFWPLAAEVTSIGRAQDCAISLHDDQQTSRVHAEVRCFGERWEIVDLDSSNGVFVCGQEVLDAPLRDGDVIRIGSTLLIFRRQGLAAEQQRHAAWLDGLVSGPSLARTRDLLRKAACSDLSVLVTGESGTGKELAARALHDAGYRAPGPFVAVNCSALPREMVESELFGHVRGAFTGAVADNPGLVRQAHGGTLFLDEIAELQVDCQAKLLRVLQERSVRPVGGQAAREVDLRLVCATNRELPAEVERGAFRHDLYARIAEMVIDLPPLRSRLEDIPLLVAHFVRKHGKEGVAVAVEALEGLCSRPWPYNVRELESAVRRALLLAEGAPVLTLEHFEQGESIGPATAGGAVPTRNPGLAHRSLAELREREALEAALREHEGDPVAVARALGISRSQLYRRASKLGLRVGAFKKRD